MKYKKRELRILRLPEIHVKMVRFPGGASLLPAPADPTGAPALPDRGRVVLAQSHRVRRGHNCIFIGREDVPIKGVISQRGKASHAAGNYNRNFYCFNIHN